MEFQSSDKKRLEIINRRYKYEKKWWGFRWSIRILSVVGIVAIALSVYRFLFNIGNSAENFLFLCISIPSGILIPFFLKMVARSTLSSWVTDRFSENLKIENGIMVREYSFSLGAGYMNLIEGKDRMIVTINLSDIHDLKMCEKTGRIQFSARDRITYYSDWQNKVLEQDYIEQDAISVFYNYFEPDLIQYFKDSGIPYIEGDMDFKRGE